MVYKATRILISVREERKDAEPIRAIVEMAGRQKITELDLNKDMGRVQIPTLQFSCNSLWFTFLKAEVETLWESESASLHDDTGDEETTLYLKAYHVKTIKMRRSNPNT
ncbi:MAG TPA: hypothetical protein VD736_06865 [Nitrososphaera sp.]|nr:hypothetical protein [Nitrososphaera sp.]